jgi:hypothetical protein
LKELSCSNSYHDKAVTVDDTLIKGLEAGRLGSWKARKSESLEAGKSGGGDKPRHYKRRLSPQVGMGFIPARK